MNLLLVRQGKNQDSQRIATATATVIKRVVHNEATTTQMEYILNDILQHEYTPATHKICSHKPSVVAVNSQRLYSIHDRAKAKPDTQN